MNRLQEHLERMTQQASPQSPLSPVKPKRKKRKLRTKIPAGFDKARTARKMRQVKRRAERARESDPDGVEIGQEASHFRTATGEQAEMVARFEVHFSKPYDEEERIRYPELIPVWMRKECRDLLKEAQEKDEQSGSESTEGEEGV